MLVCIVFCMKVTCRWYRSAEAEDTRMKFGRGFRYREMSLTSSWNEPALNFAFGYWLTSDPHTHTHTHTRRKEGSQLWRKHVYNFVASYYIITVRSSWWQLPLMTPRPPPLVVRIGLRGSLVCSWKNTNTYSRERGKGGGAGRQNQPMKSTVSFQWNHFTQ